eukprot:FR739971.1.p1 GENE.FR739971.1~~FR739971.1.p1  ORF type:complete len:100 (-),score=7.98 FR739971.1:15-314(-)
MSQQQQYQLTPILSSGGSFTGVGMIQPPDSLNDDEAEDEPDIERPLNLNEMRRQTAEKLMRSGGLPIGRAGGGVSNRGERNDRQTRVSKNLGVARKFKK